MGILKDRKAIQTAARHIFAHQQRKYTHLQSPIVRGTHCEAMGYY